MMETEQKEIPLFLYFRASYHISGEKEVFTTIRASSGTCINMIGGQCHNVTGIGNVAIKLPSGEIQKIEHILYSPSIIKNLLSYRFLASKEVSIEFREQNCTIGNSSGKIIIITAMKKPDSSLYKLMGEIMQCYFEILFTQGKKHKLLSILWHPWQGYTHYHGMKRMVPNGAIKGLPQIIVGNIPCEVYTFGKESKTKIPKEHTINTSNILQLVHLDVCGPFRIHSLGGAMYSPKISQN